MPSPMYRLRLVSWFRSSGIPSGVFVSPPAAENWLKSSANRGEGKRFSRLVRSPSVLRTTVGRATVEFELYSFTGWAEMSLTPNQLTAVTGLLLTSPPSAGGAGEIGVVA